MSNKYFILLFFIFAFVGEIVSKTNDVIEAFNVKKQFGFQNQFFSNLKDQKVDKEIKEDHQDRSDILTEDENISLFNEINPNIDMVTQIVDWNSAEEQTTVLVFSSQDYEIHFVFKKDLISYKLLVSAIL